MIPPIIGITAIVLAAGYGLYLAVEPARRIAIVFGLDMAVRAIKHGQRRKSLLIGAVLGSSLLSRCCRTCQAMSSLTMSA